MQDWFSFDDVPWSRLTDQSGRRWKPREILGMARRDFIREFDYYGREGTMVYGMVAADAKREEAAKLPEAERRRFAVVDRLARGWRSETVRLAGQLDFWDYQGTAGAGAFLGFCADGEFRLRRAVMGWGVDTAGGRGRYRAASARLRDRANRRVHEPLRFPKSAFQPDQQTVRGAWRRLERDLDAMDDLAAALHSYPLALLADDLAEATQILRPPRTHR